MKREEKAYTQHEYSIRMRTAPCSTDERSEKVDNTQHECRTAEERSEKVDNTQHERRTAEEQAGRQTPSMSVVP